MRLSRRKSTRSPLGGFTLVEIVLVLAIAGLLLAIVLVAYRGVSKTRRDFERRSYLPRVEASLETYYSTHLHYPNPTNSAEITDYVDNYLPKQKDPSSGLAYSPANGNFFYRDNGASHSDIPDPGTLYIQYGHWCSIPGRPGLDAPDDPISSVGDDYANVNQYVIWIGLESGRYSCVDNYSK